MKRGPHDLTVLRHLSTMLGGKESTNGVAVLCRISTTIARSMLLRLARQGLIDRPPYPGLMNPWWRITESGRAELTL